MKIGAITVGQSPRVDVTADILRLFDPSIELIEKGGLDGLTRHEIEQFKPTGDDYVLVSRLTDGSSVTFAEKHILPRLQEAIHELEAQGVQLIMMFCTGKFPDTLQSKVPMIYPCDLLDRLVPLFSGGQKITVVIPSPLQIEQSRQKWLDFVEDVEVVAVSPYGDFKTIEACAQTQNETTSQLFVLDCIGYSQKMKEAFRKATEKAVILPRTLLARVVGEIANEEV